MGKVEITIVEARNLKNNQLIGVPDPFVRVIFKDKKYKTAPVKDTLNPVWKETFRFQIPDENSNQIQLEVWNKGAVSDDLLGYYYISLGGLTRGVVKDEWFILEKSKTLAELRVRILAVDFGERPTPEQAWMVTNDINHDPVQFAIEEGKWKPGQKTPPPHVRPPSTEFSGNVQPSAPLSGQYPLQQPMPQGVPPASFAPLQSQPPYPPPPPPPGQYPSVPPMSYMPPPQMPFSPSPPGQYGPGQYGPGSYSAGAYPPGPPMSCVPPQQMAYPQPPRPGQYPPGQYGPGGYAPAPQMPPGPRMPYIPPSNAAMDYMNPIPTTYQHPQPGQYPSAPYPSNQGYGMTPSLASGQPLFPYYMAAPQPGQPQAKPGIYY